MNAGGHVSRRVLVRPKAPARDVPTRDYVDLTSHVLCPAALATFDFGDQVRANAENAFLSHLFEPGPVGGSEIELEVHRGKGTTCPPKVKMCPPRLFVPMPENGRMASDFWSKRGLFVDWVHEAKARLGGTNADVAELMDLAPQSLKKYLSPNGTHKPGDDALRRLGDFLGYDYRMLLDDPGTAPPGIDPKYWEDADEDTKIFNKTMFSMSGTMTPEIRSVLIQMAKVGHAKAIKKIEESKEIDSKKKRK